MQITLLKTFQRLAMGLLTGVFLSGHPVVQPKGSEKSTEISKLVSAGSRSGSGRMIICVDC